MSIIQFVFYLKSALFHQKILTLWLGVVWVLGLEFIGNASESPEESVVSKRYQFESKHMGTLFRIIIYATDADAESVRNASQDAFQRIDELNGIFSDYLQESELNKLSRRSGTGDFTSVSEPLWRILKYSVKVSELSGGAFDVTVGPSVRLWRRAMRRAEYPDSKRLQSALEAVGYSKIIFHPNLRSIQLLDSSMRLDLGGIAKGYAVDEASAVLKRHGFNHCLVEGGGDLKVCDAPPGRKGWRIALLHLDSKGNTYERILVLSDMAVATSGDLYQFVEIDGTRYSHIIDPRNGVALSNAITSSVIAPNGMMADALASATSVLGGYEAIRLMNKFKGCYCYVVESDSEGELIRYRSAGFDELDSLKTEKKGHPREWPLKL